MYANIELQKSPPLLVEISSYGANEGTYYKVTGIQGTFNRVLMNCKNLKEAGTRVALRFRKKKLQIKLVYLYKHIVLSKHERNQHHGQLY